MKIKYREDMANHSDPESCVAHREVCCEALTGDTDKPAIEMRNQGFGMPTTLTNSEGHTEHDADRKSCFDPAQSETLRMSGSNLHRSWEISAVSTEYRGLGEEGVSHHVAIYAAEKSDTPILRKKPSNKAGMAEMAEERRSSRGEDRPFARRADIELGCCVDGNGRSAPSCQEGQTDEIHGTAATCNTWVNGGKFL